MKKCFILTTLLLSTLSICEAIVLKNHTEKTVFAGIYYVEANIFGKSKGPAQRISSAITLAPHTKTLLDRPDYAFCCNREIIFSVNKQDVSVTIEKEKYKTLPTIDAGWAHGNKFHIAYDDTLLQGYDYIDWKIYHVTSLFDTFIDSIIAQHSQHSYAQTAATSFPDSSIPIAEKTFVTERKKIVKAKLEDLLQMPIENEYIPCIGVCMSGGGMRAAMAALGLFEGLNQINMLDTLTYACGLSGSTWFLSQYVYAGLPLGSYHGLFLDALCVPHFFSISSVTDMLWKKYAFGQQMSIVDLYGVYLANTFFHHLPNENDRQKITLSELGAHALPEKMPYPLFTAGETNEAFHWTTFSPHMCSCETLKMNCPPWAFGRTFVNGTSTNFAPEQSLGFMMGIWGSALSGSLEEMLATQAHLLDEWLYNSLQGVLSVTGLDDIRFATIKMHNPMYQVDHTPYKKKKDLIFVDAGYEYNLPIMPLVQNERKADVIFILDASANALEIPVEMQKAENHLRSIGIALPKFEYELFGKQQIVIMHDTQNPQAPLLIYVAAVQNDTYSTTFDPKTAIPETYPTTRFLYEREDVEQFAGLLKHNIAENKERIYAAIKEHIMLKTELVV